MPQAWVRIAGGLAVFAFIGIVGLGLLGGLEFEAALDTFAVVMIVAIPAGIAAYALIEYAQTRRLDSIRRQFDTRTLVLMPVAMAMLGGSGVIIGPVIGAVFLLIVEETLWTRFAYLHTAAYGLVILCVGLFMPGGLVRLRPLRRFLVRVGLFNEL